MLGGWRQDTAVSFVATRGYEVKLYCTRDLALQTSGINLLHAQQSFFPAVPALGWELALLLPSHLFLFHPSRFGSKQRFSHSQEGAGKQEDCSPQLLQPLTFEKGQSWRVVWGREAKALIAADEEKC